ncbi:uncharacterized protein LOC120901090 [Anopheles arabiensis]|uniref:uncharacterized protein LOC120901090 n=1 Tax=Anopheles arabiensis TaxID=7173 RepID=UPI001AAD878D|nr:uncharacterized protein LOC120901090 [Anopheles arabiensis]
MTLMLMTTDQLENSKRKQTRTTARKDCVQNNREILCENSGKGKTSFHPEIWQHSPEYDRAAVCVCMPTKYDAVSTTITKAGCDRDRHILNQRCHTPQNSMERKVL